MPLRSTLLQLAQKAMPLGLSVLVIAALSAWSLSDPGPSEMVLTSAPATPTGTAASGYWLVGADGGVFNFGDTEFHGSAGSLHLTASIVGMAATPDGGGYWLVASDGGVFSYGDAVFHGSTGGLRLNKPIVGMAATPDGGGYWIVASDGGVFSYGDAVFNGSTGGLRLNKPIVSMAATPGGGYWLVASDGGVFTYGDAVFHGSAGSLHLNAPIVAMAATPGGGYWLVASDGGVFTYGDAMFHGSTGGLRLNKPVVGMAATPDGGGYWLVASDGGVFNYGDASFEGSTGSLHLNAPVVAAASGSGGSGGSGGTVTPPTSPPVTWCETGLPTSPYSTPPSGAVSIPAGDDSTTAIAHDYTIQPNTTYWFAPGTHTLGSSKYASVNVDPGDTFVGAPGAVLDGQGDNGYAFTAAGTESSPANATIEYLTVQHFVAGGGEAVVGMGDHNGWTVRDNLIENNPDGAGVLIESNDVVKDNCLQLNGEYGFNGGGASPADNAVLTGNDIYDNNNAHAFDFPGSPPNNQCGCSGGGKWWDSINDQTTGNYIHDNQGVGIWVDTDNAGQLISGNYISNSWGEGIIYEISYNAQITDNTFVGNGLGEGSIQASPGFPDGAIYISESGGDTRVASNYAGQFVVSQNVLTNNWGGIILWENADRYCSDGSDGACTLVDPSVDTVSSCAAHLSETSPVDYYDNCRWKTQNVLVEDNTLNLDTAQVGASCTVNNLCGFNGLFSDYGTSIYGDTPTVAVAFHQNNEFKDNVYNGPWNFFAWSLSNLANPVTWAEWTAPVTDQCDRAGELSSGTCSSGFGQDTGSALG